jgi:hypothetical protein
MVSRYDLLKIVEEVTMKRLILILAAIFSLSAFGNCNREAQFMGTVKNVNYFPAQEGRIEHYSFEIELDPQWFRPSIVCPMSEAELENAIIYEAGLPKRANGDSISGVLVFDQKIQNYKLD